MLLHLLVMNPDRLVREGGYGRGMMENRKPRKELTRVSRRELQLARHALGLAPRNCLGPKQKVRDGIVSWPQRIASEKHEEEGRAK